MNKYIEAIDKIQHEYDAFFILNKYGEGTHAKEFELLSELDGDDVASALAWIRDCYDCYDEEAVIAEAGNPFEYLRQQAEDKG